MATEVWRMQLTDIAMRPRLRGSEPYGYLGLGLDDLFNPKIFDLKAMGVLQLIDERELYFIPLGHHQARGQPDLSAVERRVDQGKLLGCSGCGVTGAKHQ
jgi:hypothetical protein